MFELIIENEQFHKKVENIYIAGESREFSDFGGDFSFICEMDDVLFFTHWFHGILFKMDERLNAFDYKKAIKVLHLSDMKSDILSGCWPKSICYQEGERSGFEVTITYDSKVDKTKEGVSNE